MDNTEKLLTKTQAIELKSAYMTVTKNKDSIICVKSEVVDGERKEVSIIVYNDDWKRFKDDEDASIYFNRELNKYIDRETDIDVDVKLSRSEIFYLIGKITDVDSKIFKKLYSFLS